MNPMTVVAIFAGAVLCFFGYPIIHSAIRVWGFIIGGVFITFFAVTVLRIPGGLSEPTVQMGIFFVVGGAIGALIAGPLSILIIFLSGTALGAVIGMYAYPYFIRGQESMLLTIGLALITGFLSVRFQEIVLIVTTSFIGALLVIYGARELSALEMLPAAGLFFLIGFFGAAAQYKSLNPRSSVLGF